MYIIESEQFIPDELIEAFNYVRLQFCFVNFAKEI